MSASRTILLAALAGCLSVSCATTASDWRPAPFRAGQQRLAIGTNTYTQKTTDDGMGGSSDNDLLALNGSFGYFYQPNVEFGGILGYQDADIAGTDSTMWTIDGYMRYWIDTRNSARPFVQGRVGIGNREVASVDDDLVQYAFGAGISDFLSQNTSVDLLLEWSDQQFDNSDEQTDGLELSVFFSVFF